MPRLARQAANYVNAIKETRRGKMSKTFKQSVLAMQGKIQGRLKQEGNEVYVRATPEEVVAMRLLACTLSHMFGPVPCVDFGDFEHSSRNCTCCDHTKTCEKCGYYGEDRE